MDSRQQCKRNYREKAERGRRLGEERKEKKGGSPEAVRRRGKEPDKKDWSTHWKKMTTPGADIREFLWMTEARLISVGPGQVVGAQNRIHSEDSGIKKLQDKMNFWKGSEAFGTVAGSSRCQGPKKNVCALFSLELVPRCLFQISVPFCFYLSLDVGIVGVIGNWAQ